MLLIVFLREFFHIFVDWNIFNLSAVIFLTSLFIVVTISLFTKPADPEKLEAVIWKRRMLKLPTEELMRRYPWWKWIGFWFAVLVGCFVVIYIKFW